MDDGWEEGDTGMAVRSGVAIPVVVESGDGAKLKANTLTLWDSTVIAVTSTAPAYSVAASMFLMIGAVGLAAPAAILISFAPVLGIAIAYFYLNRANPNCGASYVWLTQAMGPWMGWFTGWVQVATNAFFLVTASELAGINTLAFLNSLGWIGAAAAGSVWLTAAVSVLWFFFVAALTIIGVQVAARFQAIMLTIEYVALAAFSVLALARVATTHPKGSTPFSWQWFNPLSIHGTDALAAGAVIAVFFFWGWDTAANVNEETKDTHLTPGRAGMIGMVVLLFIFLLSSSAMQALLPRTTIQNQGANALQYFADQLVPAPWSYVMLLAILSSTVATLQTTLLPATRLTLSMARDGVWPRAFAVIHARYRTPVIGTLILTAITVVGLVLSTLSPSVNQTLNNLTNNIGVLVGFYYGITGIACAWYFRRTLRRSLVSLVFTGVAPLLGGVFLIWIGYQVVIQGQQAGGWSVVLPVLVVGVFGVPLAVVARLYNPRYFTRRARAYDPGGETLETTARVAEA